LIEKDTVEGLVVDTDLSHLQVLPASLDLIGAGPPEIPW
jgi:hypothetical protein